MTKEEIVQGLYRGDSKAIKEAIKALEQQSSDDCVSRAEVNKLYDEYRPRLATHVSEFGDKLKALSPVAPTRKVGKWIKSNIGGAKVCSICQAHMGLSNFKYCPNCGAEMKGGENGQ